MLPILLSIFSLLPLTTPTNITQSRLLNIQSGISVVYQNNSTIIPTNTQTTFDILYSKSHPTPPTPFYFLNRYRMKDKFLYENFYSYVKSADVDKWQLTVEPVATTSVLMLSVSYIAVENIYQNFFVKEYTYGVQAGLASGTGNRSYTATYNFSQQFIGRTLSGNSSQNKLIASWVGFLRSNSFSSVADMNVNSFFTNTSFYSVAISTSTSSADWWNRTNVMVCIINMQKFPTNVRILTGSVVLSPANTIISWTEFQQFANVSYCFGYSGINANANDVLNMFWTQHNGTAIKATLSLLNYARYSYVILWNETVIPNPVPPAPPVDPTTPNNNTTNNNTTNNNTTPIAPVDPIDPIPKPNPNPNPNPSDNSNTNNLSKLPQQQPPSNTPIGLIIGVVIGVIVVGVIVVFVIYRFRQNKGKRVPIPENQKEFQIFTPSFV